MLGTHRDNPALKTSDQCGDDDNNNNCSCNNYNN